jgi:DNA-binding NarL/FixJ family response regulator
VISAGSVREKEKNMSEKTKVLIVDDHPVVIEGLKGVIEADPDFELAGTAQDGQEALTMIRSLDPDIVILDILMPGMDGVEVSQKIREWNDRIKILIYSMSASGEAVVSLFRSGISGYVLKEEPFSELALALKTVKEGAVFYSETVRAVLQNHMKELELGKGKNVDEVQDDLATLSTREKEVFVLLADGLPIKEIATRLYISPKTVETHKYNIMEKLDLHSLAGFTKLAAKKKLIEI